MSRSVHGRDRAIPPLDHSVRPFTRPFFSEDTVRVEDGEADGCGGDDGEAFFCEVDVRQEPDDEGDREQPGYRFTDIESRVSCIYFSIDLIPGCQM